MKPIVAYLLAFLLLCQSAWTEEYKLRVGIAAPLTGESSTVGEAMKSSVALALDSLPEEVRKKLEIKFEDDGLQPRKAVDAYHAFNKAGIDALISITSGCSNAIAPLVERDKLPTIALATDPAVVRGRKWIVNFYVSDVTEARAVFAEATRRGYRRIARVWTIQDFVLAVKSSFDAINKGQIVAAFDQEFPVDVRDFRSTISKIKALKDLDAILVTLFPGQLGLFTKQLRQAGVTQPIFGFEMLEDAGEVKASEGALIGAWYVNSDEPTDVFLNQYRSRFPEASTLAASNMHDAILLLGAAAEKNMTREQLNEFLHTLKDFKGALGTYSATGDGRFTLPAAIKVVTKEGFERISSFLPES